VLLMVLVAVAAPALAQAPAAPAPSPRVTITGLVDMVSSWSKNMSILDVNPSRSGDTEFYARSRLRPDITAELGTTKFVLGLEIDYAWGQVAGQDTNVCLNAACAGAGQRFGTTVGMDLNTDTQGNLELKWGYLEFRMPLIPWVTTVRLGAQPFQVMYKSGIYATGDFAGVHVSSTITPQVKLHGTYVQIEEDLTGSRDIAVPRGEDWAFIGSVEVTPFKGLDLRPMVSYFSASGVTSGSSRVASGGVANAAAVFPVPGGAPFASAGVRNFSEDRYTVGIDSRFTAGPFFVDPTVLYQFGDRTLVAPTNGVVQSQGLSAWLFDVRGGWRLGPLLLEAGGMYSTGNRAEENLRHGRRNVNYFQPLSLDGGNWGTWCEILCLGIDYFNSIFSSVSPVSTISHIGYDKYGLMRLAARASYAVTPAFSLRGTIMGNWTAEKVDTSEVISTGTGRVTCEVGDGVAGLCGNQISDGRGDSRYLGTEIDLGLTWRFAPGIAFDLVGGYLFAGSAYASHTSGAVAGSGINGQRNNRNPQDIQTVATRVRFTF
jgi:hypothetical protein